MARSVHQRKEGIGVAITPEGVGQALGGDLSGPLAALLLLG
jgi:hypothetical protein